MHPNLVAIAFTLLAIHAHAVPMQYAENDNEDGFGAISMARNFFRGAGSTSSSQPNRINTNFKSFFEDNITEKVEDPPENEYIKPGRREPPSTPTRGSSKHEDIAALIAARYPDLAEREDGDQAEDEVPLHAKDEDVFPEADDASSGWSEEDYEEAEVLPIEEFEMREAQRQALEPSPRTSDPSSTGTPDIIELTKKPASDGSSDESDTTFQSARENFDAKTSTESDEDTFYNARAFFNTKLKVRPEVETPQPVRPSMSIASLTVDEETFYPPVNYQRNKLASQVPSKHSRYPKLDYYPHVRPAFSAPIQPGKEDPVLDVAPIDDINLPPGIQRYSVQQVQRYVDTSEIEPASPIAPQPRPLTLVDLPEIRPVKEDDTQSEFPASTSSSVKSARIHEPSREAMRPARRWSDVFDKLEHIRRPFHAAQDAAERRRERYLRAPLDKKGLNVYGASQRDLDGVAQHAMLVLDVIRDDMVKLRAPGNKERRNEPHDVQRQFDVFSDQVADVVRWTKPCAKVTSWNHVVQKLDEATQEYVKTVSQADIKRQMGRLSLSAMFDVSADVAVRLECIRHDIRRLRAREVESNYSGVGAYTVKLGGQVHRMLKEVVAAQEKQRSERE